MMSGMCVLVFSPSAERAGNNPGSPCPPELNNMIVFFFFWQPSLLPSCPGSYHVSSFHVTSKVLSNPTTSLCLRLNRPRFQTRCAIPSVSSTKDYLSAAKLSDPFTLWVFLQLYPSIMDWFTFPLTVLSALHIWLSSLVPYFTKARNDFV